MSLANDLSERVLIAIVVGIKGFMVKPNGFMRVSPI